MVGMQPQGYLKQTEQILCIPGIGHKAPSLRPRRVKELGYSVLLKALRDNTTRGFPLNILWLDKNRNDIRRGEAPAADRIHD